MQVLDAATDVLADADADVDADDEENDDVEDTEGDDDAAAPEFSLGMLVAGVPPHAVGTVRKTIAIQHVATWRTARPISWR